MRVLICLAAALVVAAPATAQDQLIPDLIAPRTAKKLSPLPGGEWAYVLPRHARVVGRDARSKTMSIALPWYGNWCEVRLVTLVAPKGTPGTLAMVARARLSKLSAVRQQPAVRVGQGSLRVLGTYTPLNNPTLRRFFGEWYRVENGVGLVVHTDGPIALQAACTGMTEALVLGMKRVSAP
jgi:hypothetical protein